ncbi:hypothetical protein GCM10028801_38100 [Nocardioides maradonensis]
MTTLTLPVARTGIAPLGRREVTQWLAPAPLWDGLDVGPGAAGLAAPFIAELTTDRFVDVFTGTLAGAGGASPADLATMVPAITVDGTPTGAYRLFQPLSQRYYLVTASLVCRRPGIPDHTVDVRAKESVGFVMRRLEDGAEQAFVPGEGGGTWVSPAGGALADGEQVHPMHPAPVAPYAEPGTTTAGLGLDAATGSGRTVWFGYVPVAQRETMAKAMDDPAGRIADLVANPPPLTTVTDPRVDWLYQRVLLTWGGLKGHDDAAGDTVDVPGNVRYPSLYTLLDLGDWMQQHLPDVYDHVVHGTTLPSGSADQAFADLLHATEVQKGGSDVRLDQAVADTVPYAALLTGDDIAAPDDYDLSQVANLASVTGYTGSFMSAARAAIAAGGRPVPIPPELDGMIREDAGAPFTPGKGPTYVIRVVYRHDPCVPVLSTATHPFELARALDPDAPARRILLQMPDITNMRKFNRGVAIETPPALQKILNGLTPDVLKGDTPDDTGLALGFICSFSLQIIFLVAFIVMFIFLILLNICFFWMPFLKICLPIPVPAQQPKGPTP